MQAAVDSGVFPGAVLLVRYRGAIRFHRAFGQASLLPSPTPARLETVYDLASLTKPLATATSLLLLMQDGRLSLDEPIVSWFGELQPRPLGLATVRHLLAHCSGLPPWRAYYERIAERDRRERGFLGSPTAKEAVSAYLRDEELLAPVATKTAYSDLGFILLGFLIERLAGCSLASFVEERIVAPLHARPLGFRPDTWPGFDPQAVAATEEDAWRGRVLRGIVHDENAHALGGVAGHAGLFGTADAVLALSGAWLAAVRGQPSMLDAALAREFVRRQDLLVGSSWALGWDTPSAPSSSGTRLSPKSFGHLGYTGTSLWVDPEQELEVVLLSNRVHPTRRNDKIREFRPKIHDIICQELIADS